MQPGVEDEAVSMCSYADCMQRRRLAVRNHHDFDCKHLKIAKDSIDSDNVERCVLIEMYKY